MAKNTIKMVPKPKKQKLTLAVLFELRSIIQKIVTQPMEAEAAYKLSKFAKKVNEEYDTIESVRKSLIEKHGAKFKNKQGGIFIPNEAPEFNNFMKDFEEFLSQESDIDLEPIKLEHLKDIQISALEMAKLSDYIE